MQWIPILEEYSPELIDIQGSKNIAADVWSGLDIVDTPNHVKIILNLSMGQKMQTFHTLQIIKLLCEINRKIKIEKNRTE